MKTTMVDLLSCVGRLLNSCRFGMSVLTIFLIISPGITSFAGENEPAPSPAPGGYRMLSDSGFARFPFEIFRGDIRFCGEINGWPVHLLLDDGFMWDPILFWGSPRVDSLGLKYDNQTTIGELDDENALASKTASGITVSFPGVEFTDQTAIITPYSSGVSKMWWGSEGQVSGTFLKHFVVDINFDKMEITLIEPEGFEYDDRGVEIPWKPLGFGPWAIPARLGLADGRTVSVELMMDLGYNDQLQICTKGEHNITVPQQVLPVSLGFNIQGEETRGFCGRVRQVDIGGYQVKGVIAGFVAEEHSDHTYHEVMIGLGLLSRFNLVFDYSRQRMFVEPSRSFAEPFEYNMSGFSMKRGSGGFCSIIRVHDDSPASEAGLLAGDRVTKINGIAATEYDYWDLFPLMRQEGKTINLVVLRGNQELRVSITLRRLL